MTKLNGPKVKFALFFIVLFFSIIVMAFNVLSSKLATIPYDGSNPVVYDNDETIDVYTDEYLMALSSLGEIELLGFVTSSSIHPFNKWVSEEDFDRFLREREYGIQAAEQSGFNHLPAHYKGTMGHLREPASGLIDDTKPIGSEGSRFIVEAANQCSSERPLVLVMGGPLTVAADAYLLDPGIHDKIVVGWLGGRSDDMGDYNGWADPWAAYIVLQRLRLVQFPTGRAGGKMGAPKVLKHQLETLPPSELREWMISKQHPNGLPDERDADAPPAIFMMRPDYIVRSKHLRAAINLGVAQIQESQIRRVSFSHWVQRDPDGRKIPAFQEDPNGNAINVRYADHAVATEEWWRAIETSLAAPH